MKCFTCKHYQSGKVKVYISNPTDPGSKEILADTDLCKAFGSYRLLEKPKENCILYSDRDKG